MFHDHLHGNLLSYCRECAGFSWRTKVIKVKEWSEEWPRKRAKGAKG
jgi:hypothetical protein